MPGCRDPRPASDSRAIELPYALWFGGPSHNWHGGPAFLDLATPGRTIARAWLVTREQFGDIVAQENHLAPGSVEIAPHLLEEGGVLLPSSRYGRLVALDPIDGRPAVTFTYVDRPEARPPDPAYVDLLRGGLQELGYGDAEADRYLTGCIGSR